MNVSDFALGEQSVVLPGQLDGSRPSVSAPQSHRDGIVVFSGGSAANNLVDVFNRVRQVNQTTLSYIIPISDNGGSSSEVIRVFGGPGNVTRP